MKVKMLRNVFIGGQPVETGDEVEVDEQTGKWLVNRGKAEKVEAKPKAKPKTKAKQTATSKAAEKRETRGDESDSDG